MCSWWCSIGESSSCIWSGRLCPVRRICTDSRGKVGDGPVNGFIRATFLDAADYILVNLFEYSPTTYMFIIVPTSLRVFELCPGPMCEVGSHATVCACQLQSLRGQ